MFAEVLQYYFQMIYDNTSESLDYSNRRHELEDNVMMWANVGALTVKIVDRLVPLELVINHL